MLQNFFRISDDKYFMAGGYAGEFPECDLDNKERPKFCDEAGVVTNMIHNLAWIYDKGSWRNVGNMSVPRVFHHCSLMHKKDANVSTMLQKLSKCEVKA